MAAAGDSITVAYNASGFGELPQYSWATGSSQTIGSHWRQLQSRSTDTITAHNFAQVGATSAELGAQVASAASVGADYLTIEIGANDACTPTVASMTPVATFQQRISAALQSYASARPIGKVFIASIPNLYRMWQVSRSSFSARFIWSIASVCQSMLANANSTTATNEARRQEVQARVDAYNAVIASACAATPRCTYDGGAVADYVFTSAHISTSDYFHPSIAGQTVLASITWARSPYASGP